jgi:hypothetical protein
MFNLAVRLGQIGQTQSTVLKQSQFDGLLYGNVQQLGIDVVRLLSGG